MTTRALSQNPTDGPSETAALLAAISEQLLELIFATDLDGRLMYVSPAASRLTGWSAQEVAGRHFSVLLDPASVPVALEAFNAVVVHGTPVEALRTSLVRKDGTTFVGELNGARLVSDGRTLGTTGVIRDITKYVIAEATLREREELYRVLFDGISDAVFVNEVLPDDTPGRFLQVNEVACRRLGYTRDEMLQLTPREISTPATFSEAAARRKSLVERSSALIESVHVAKDGRQIPVESHIRYLTYLGRPAALSISRDLTERKRHEEHRLELERRFLQMQKIQSLGVLAGGVAHDFNNILVAVLGYAELALSDLPETSPARDSVAQIGVAAHRAAELCGQMLAYSGRGQFVVERLDLNRLVTGMLHLLRASVPRRASLKADLREPIPACDGDAAQIRQLVANLVTNASEAVGDADGAITLSTSTAVLTEEDLAAAAFQGDARPGEFVCLEVADTGCGMDEETAGRVFEPFFSTKFTGRGLGMAAVLGIVRAHRGVIRIETTPARGTVVRVYLPPA